MEMKERVCLRCGKKFQSEGPQNRICPHCARGNPKTSPSYKSMWGMPQRKGKNSAAI